MTTTDRNPQAGVTLIEVMMAAMILTIALLAAAMTMSQGIVSLYFTQEQLIAKQKGREALESVFTARSTQNILYNQIENNDVNGGIFLTGYQSVRGMGVDGIANTTDDSATAIETMQFVGKDGTWGTTDDEIRTLSRFTREIVIDNVLLTNGNVDPDVRKITVNVRFSVRGYNYFVSVSSYIARFA